MQFTIKLKQQKTIPKSRIGVDGSEAQSDGGPEYGQAGLPGVGGRRTGFLGSSYSMCVCVCVCLRAHVSYGGNSKRSSLAGVSPAVVSQQSK